MHFRLQRRLQGLRNVSEGGVGAIIVFVCCAYYLFVFKFMLFIYISYIINW